MAISPEAGGAHTAHLWVSAWTEPYIQASLASPLMQSPVGGQEAWTPLPELAHSSRPPEHSAGTVGSPHSCVPPTKYSSLPCGPCPSGFSAGGPQTRS